MRHPQLGDIELFLSEIEEINNTSKPYTSVIIGPNGTGKSFILKIISEIFTQLNIFKTSDIKSINIPYAFHLRYKIGKDYFDIISKYEILTKSKGEKRIYSFNKNRPFSKTGINIIDKGKNYHIDFEDLIFPNHVIVSSVMLNDRFKFKKSLPDDFYQYLGIRATSSTASTKSSVKGVVKTMFNESISNNDFLKSLEELLGFLDFDKKFEVEYKTKLNKLFFSGELTIENFKQYYEFWWDDNFDYTNRSEENPVWSKPYYDRVFKNDHNKIKEIVGYLNSLKTDNKLNRKDNSKSNLIRIDLFNKNTKVNDVVAILELERLDILNINGINLNKKNSSLNINDISSGEYHLLISLIGIFSKIKEDSLILIDEPEISLHPNWQMQYISFLKKVFSNFASCHFILTSHSHFIVSDLKGDSSSVTSLTRNEDNKLSSKILHLDTYGWSAEDILYNVFNVRSTWNYFLEADLTELLGMISQNSKEKKKIKGIINKLERLPTRNNDPLIDILKEANAYLTII